MHESRAIREATKATGWERVDEGEVAAEKRSVEEVESVGA